MASKKAPKETKESKDLAAAKKLVEGPSPTAERVAQGDWVKSNNPSPEEQRAERERTKALMDIRRSE